MSENLRTEAQFQEIMHLLMQLQAAVHDLAGYTGRIEEELRFFLRHVAEFPLKEALRDVGGETAIRRSFSNFFLSLPFEIRNEIAKAWNDELGRSGKEYEVQPWKHLVARFHPWRRQLYLRGRNMTVRQLVGTVKANNFTPEEAADDLDLPVGAIHEAFRYAEENKELLDYESARERYLFWQGGQGHAAQAVPG